MLPKGTSLAHATFSDSGPQFPPDTLQHMTDGCGTTLGTFFGLCEGRPLSQPMGPPKKGTPWENKVCKMFFGNCGFVLMEMNSVAAVFQDKTISRGGFLEDKWCFRIKFGLQFFSCILECFYKISRSDVHSPKSQQIVFCCTCQGLKSFLLGINSSHL